MDEKETLKTSEKPDAQEVSDEALDQVNGGKVVLRASCGDPWINHRDVE